MQSSLNVASGPVPATPSGMSARIVLTVTVVALMHIALIATIMRITERPPLRYPLHYPLRSAIESRVITAQLLQPEPVPAQAAVPVLNSAAHPAPAARPVAPKRAKSHVPPPPALAKPVPLPAPALTPAPAQAAEPAAAPPNATSAHEPVDAQIAKESQQNSPQVPADAPADGRETLAIAAPKSVRPIDCRIVKPDYPALSRRRGETGTADIRFVVGPTGAIERVELAKSSGYARLDDAALAAMRASSCHPYVENGTPMRAIYTQPFGFALDE
jgi:periplasmic protein TonB